MNRLNFTAVAPAVGLNFSIVAMAIAVGLTFSPGVMAKSMSNDEYQFLDKNIEAEYKAAKTRCTLLSGGENNQCVVEAVAEKKKAKAELDAKFKAPVSSQSDPRIAKAELLKNEKPAYSSSMTVIDKLPSTFKKSRSI